MNRSTAVDHGLYTQSHTRVKTRNDLVLQFTLCATEAKIVLGDKILAQGRPAGSRMYIRSRASLEDLAAGSELAVGASIGRSERGRQSREGVGAVHSQDSRFGNGSGGRGYKTIAEVIMVVADMMHESYRGPMKGWAPGVRI